MYRERSLYIPTLELLNNIGGDGGKFLRGLIDNFSSEFPVLVGKLKEAATAQNSKALYFYAHTLKGKSSNLGLLHMVTLCTKIEEGSATFRGLEGLFSELSEEYARVAKMLADYADKPR